MKIFPLQFCILTLASSFVLAQEKPSIPEFSAVDKDNDGILSIAEARLLFPSLTITDVEMDGLLSRKEAKLALPLLVYTNDNHEDDTQLVGAAEYLLMAEKYLQAEEEATGN
jgi:hypothetical protein